MAKQTRKKPFGEPEIDTKIEKQLPPPQPQRKLTENELRELIQRETKNYMLVEPMDYANLSPGTRIKYLRQDDGELSFRGGGYIWYAKQNEKSGRWFFIIGQSPAAVYGNSKIMHYPLFWDKIKYLWKKIDIETGKVAKTVDIQAAQIRGIISFLRKKFGDEFMREMQSYLSSN